MQCPKSIFILRFQFLAPPASVVGRMFGYFYSSKPTQPSPEYDESEKENLCRSFITANNYVYVKGEQELLMKTDKPKTTHLKSSAQFNPENHARDVNIGSRKDSLKMFRCVSDKEEKLVFHLAFGHQKGYAFVISTMNNKKENAKTVVFQGLLQPDATIDNVFVNHATKLPLVFSKNLMQIEVGLQGKNDRVWFGFTRT